MRGRRRGWGWGWGWRTGLLSLDRLNSSLCYFGVLRVFSNYLLQVKPTKVYHRANTSAFRKREKKESRLIFVCLRKSGPLGSKQRLSSSGLQPWNLFFISLAFRDVVLFSSRFLSGVDG